ncbi:hypothetical protein RCL1_007078 [Eukaryota sp. TZLM3-RCL]
MKSVRRFLGFMRSFGLMFVDSKTGNLLKPLPLQIAGKLFLPNTLLSTVFSEPIMKYKKPIIQFTMTNYSIQCRNLKFASFATCNTQVSINFRNIFFITFDVSCQIGGHVLKNCGYSNTWSILETWASNKHSPVADKWFKNYPLFLTQNLELNFGRIGFTPVIHLHMTQTQSDVSLTRQFPNLVWFWTMFPMSTH